MMTSAKNAPATDVHPGLTRNTELRAAVLELLRHKTEFDGQALLRTLKLVGVEVTQSEILSVLQHLHDHGYITCQETLRPWVSLTDLARLSRIEITPVGCELAVDL